MKLLLMLGALSIMIHQNQCNNPVKKAIYSYQLTEFKADAAIDTVAAYVHGRVFLKNGKINSTDYAVVIYPDETSEESPEMIFSSGKSASFHGKDVFGVNEKGRFSGWLSSHQKNYNILLFYQNRFVATLPKQFIRTGYSYWAEIQLRN